ncbi:hypothetical protein GCM10011376_00930 [Nocardioides flavus (ex Wang et al. 2016)]|uniref:Oligosaccharide repeat unit polymerase n=1 Tax=Nocardioides flavus (ex Wang et al. 2016) TaxID=2058780 RepID=A0ABQ3HF46_9ACTN|nr:O-antigen polymerase [Nocardioides flavus (ex Wang et al. 2016)]GHE14956.1 hypothetical protein GCM10011376_00930 [Nocardioides flavus (ex Wang et al. 2016)]
MSSASVPVMCLLLVALISAAVATKREGFGALAASSWLWVGATAILLVDPLGLAEVSWSAATVAIVGVVAMFAATFMPRGQTLPTGLLHNAWPKVPLAGLLILVSVLVAADLIGILAFRSQIAAATGSSFGQLTMEEVRRAQTSDARGGGIAALLIAANPILACVGIYAAKTGYRWAWLLPVFAVMIALQSPGRLLSVGLVVQAIAFLAYSSVGSFIARTSRKRLIFLSLLTLTAGTLIFNYVGGQLGKNSTASMYFPDYSWPQWTLSPVLYFTGGLPALSVSMDNGISPQEQGGSIFAIVRFAQALGFVATSPNTVGDFVPIPIPFNVFTGFGQIWFDFGIVGVAALSLLLGHVAVTSHRRAMRGAPEWAWVSSSSMVLVLTLPLTYRLFFLDVAVQLIVGFAVFLSLARMGERREATMRAPSRRGAQPIRRPSRRS